MQYAESTRNLIPSDFALLTTHGSVGLGDALVTLAVPFVDARGARHTGKRPKLSVSVGTETEPLDTQFPP